ncbi:DUF3459 domain-containing protein [Streptomyces sp. NPDC087844]|uniref:DUF3459 domain-containing protein n=1 Tax=Streptomyces sp. NPDC087844 TaxID=3365805 RepID=UPI003802D178
MTGRLPGAGPRRWCRTAARHLLGAVDDVPHLANGAVGVVANLGEHPVQLPPAARVLAASEPVTAQVPPDATVWFTTGEANTVREPAG